MNDKQNRKLNMYLAVQEVMDENDTVWNGYGAIVAQKTALDVGIEEIFETKMAQELDITGNAVDKAVKRRVMAKLAIQIAKPLAAFARDTDNSVLLGEIDFELSDIIKSADVTAASRCQLIHDRANTHIGSMGAYPITAGSITDLQTAITAFGDVVENPRAAKSNTEAATLALVPAFKGEDEVLEEMDELMRPFESINIDFFNEYTIARKIVDTGMRKIFLRVMVRDESNDVPILGAQVTVVPIAAPTIGGTETITVATGKTGKSNFKDLTPGSYDVTVKIGGYQDVTVRNVAVAADDLKLVEIEMVRV